MARFQYPEEVEEVTWLSWFHSYLSSLVQFLFSSVWSNER